MADWSRTNLVAACPLCLAGQRLQRRHADRESLPIWLPEIDQGALVRLVRAIHDALHAGGYPPVISLRTLPAEDTPAIRSWLIAYLTLADRARRLGAMLGGSLASPSQLFRVLRNVDPARMICPPKLAVGLRFLPLGRWFDGDRDIYATWLRAAGSGTNTGLTALFGSMAGGATGKAGGGLPGNGEPGDPSASPPPIPDAPPLSPGPLSSPIAA